MRKSTAERFGVEHQRRAGGRAVRLDEEILFQCAVCSAVVTDQTDHLRQIHKTDDLHQAIDQWHAQAREQDEGLFADLEALVRRLSARNLVTAEFQRAAREALSSGRTVVEESSG